MFRWSKFEETKDTGSQKRSPWAASFFKALNRFSVWAAPVNQSGERFKLGELSGAIVYFAILFLCWKVTDWLILTHWFFTLIIAVFLSQLVLLFFRKL